MQNMIQIQQEYIDRCLSLSDNGHAWRGEHAALKTLKKKLSKKGYIETEIQSIARDAKDMVKLERIAS